MNIVEIVSLVVTCIYTIASTIAVAAPKTKVGTACAKIALATRHDVAPKQ